MSLMKETAGLFGLLTRDPVFRFTVWEDNESCITVANSPSLLQGQSMFPSSIITFDVFLFMEQL